MVLVSLSPEGLRSFRSLPEFARTDSDGVLGAWERAQRLRLPGAFSVHELEGGRGLWTLKCGAYRGVFRWDGNKARFIRFGHRRAVYIRLPK